MNSPEVRAVGEDWDDFKVVSQAIKVNHHIEVARNFGVDLSREKVLEVWGSGLRIELATFYGHLDPEKVSDEEHAVYLEAFNALNDKYPKQLQPDTMKSHQMLVDSGLPLFLVTSHLTDNAKAEMKTVGINTDDYLFIHGSDVTEGIKPDPKAFEPALSILAEKGIQPEEVVYGGDTLTDGRAATEAGMQFVGVPSGRVSTEEFRDNGFIVVPTLTAFANFVLTKTTVSL